MLRRSLELGCLLASALVVLACAAQRGGELGQPAPAEPAPAEPATVVADEHAFVFAPAGRPVAVYDRGVRGLKPYLRSVLGADGVELLRDAPPDHEHHHGLMLALAVDDVDFWGERYADVPGRQVERLAATFDLRLEHQAPRAGLVERIAWLDPREPTERLLEQRELSLEQRELTPERRELTPERRELLPERRELLPERRELLPERRELPLDAPSAGAPLVFTWTSRLAVPDGRQSARLSGRAYFGLGMRLAEPFDRVARFTHSDDAKSELVRGDERLTAGRWCAIAAEVAGRTRTLALFAHPSNPRPARFFTMAEPFAYLSATLDLAREPLVLVRGEPRTLVYALAVWDRAAERDEIEARYADWMARAVASGVGPWTLLEGLGDPR
ncbi:MAG: PmoA family protein [Planctomycetes bacterium]|nr:PmoA family protein [Planctomycetota bacterium]